jgi:hypothetical protein
MPTIVANLVVAVECLILAELGSARSARTARGRIRKPNFRRDIYSTLTQINTDELSLPVSAFLAGSVFVYKVLSSIRNWRTWVVPVHDWFHEASTW